MTSIIGYTRTFHPSCSIAPVQRHHSNRTVKADPARTPNNYHRMFSRETTSPNGMIELIIDRNPSLSLQTSKITINTSVPDKVKHTIPRYKNYNTYLSIDLSGKHDYDGLESTTTSFDSIQRLMNFISQLAYKKTLQFVNMIEMLKKLHHHQHKYQFISCIDNQNQRILIYFPNNLSSNLNDTDTWLKQVIGVDCSVHEHWHLMCSQPKMEERKDEEFDGKEYFKEINMFIDQVDALLESNGLFSHKKRAVS
ncbi:hypothetical protein EDC96DRAFT_516878 [Choanephora cucurbitarum]|nr:hypothetical protein EDC96DRAFT_516878 [Choanephora cucurbitarum]